MKRFCPAKALIAHRRRLATTNDRRSFTLVSLIDDHKTLDRNRFALPVSVPLLTEF
jgi:hypothetical protein